MESEVFDYLGLNLTVPQCFHLEIIIIIPASGSLDREEDQYLSPRVFQCQKSGRRAVLGVTSEVGRKSGMGRKKEFQGK